MVKTYVLRPRESGASGGTCGLAAPIRQAVERPGTAADARASGHRPAPALALLSLGHKSSTSKHHLKVWQEGSRADFPGIPNLNPNRIDPGFSPGQPGDTRRGVIKEFSPKSRTRLQRSLATIKRSEDAYTMALTVPGNAEPFDHAFVMEAFTRIMRRLSSSVRFSGVSGYWKRELQKRGVIHYHLLLYGLAEDATRAGLQAWMVEQWVSLFAPRLTDTEIEHHRWFHARAENMQLVRDFCGYFSKYLGKDEEATGGLSGRWWGSFNKRKLPVSPKSEAATDAQANVMLHRLTRKYRQKRMNAARHRGIAKACGLVDSKGNPFVSEFELIGLQCQVAKLKRMKGLTLENAPPGAMHALTMVYAPSNVGKKWGKAHFKGKVPKTAPIVLCGSFAPDFAIKALEFVNCTLGRSITLVETPPRMEIILDPPKPSKRQRASSKIERPRLQSDFLGDLFMGKNRSEAPVQMDADSYYTGVATRHLWLYK